MADFFTSQALHALNQPLGAGGLVGFASLFYLPVEDLLADPVVVGGLVTTLRLRPGAGWLEWKASQGTIKFDESPKPDRTGTAYSTKITLLRSLSSAQELAALRSLNRRRFVVLLKEHSGRLRLVGSREAFLTFQAGTEGSNPAARAGIDGQFSGVMPERAVYYTGVVPVGTVALPPVGRDAPAVGTGTVQVRNHKGQLVAEVPAGTTITIRSGFRVALRFS